MQPDYYTEWVNHMAEVAGLYEEAKIDLLNILKYGMVVVFIVYIVFLCRGRAVMRCR